ncbi:MAG: hypothetical protein QOE10_45 [Gaiellales bacterium]|jgi:hypothetical protein|nr:hypothetical protein [Gaiellales bacterium]
MDSVLLGGALALTGEMQRRVAEIDRRVAERRVRERREELANAPTPPPAASPSIPGMPLPTGYGLQVRGPMGESIVLPVCLPPGFELDSMMLCPEFLPRVEAAAPAVAAPPLAAAAAPAPAPLTRPAALPVPPARPARPEAPPTAGRLDGVLQLVFGADQRFSSSLEHSEDNASSEPARGSPAVPESANR